MVFYLVKSHFVEFPEGHAAREIMRELAPEGYVVSAGLNRASAADDAVLDPVGSSISGLLSRMAREDSSIESVAKYFRRTGFPGNMAGGFRGWQPSAVYSRDVAEGVRTRPISSAVEWSDSFFLI